MFNLFYKITTIGACFLLASCTSTSTHKQQSSSPNFTFEYLVSDYHAIREKLELKSTSNIEWNQALAKRWVRSLAEKIDKNHELFLSTEVEQLIEKNKNLFKLQPVQQLEALDIVFMQARKNTDRLQPQINHWLEKRPALNSKKHYDSLQTWPNSTTEQSAQWQKKIQLDILRSLLVGMSWQETQNNLRSKWNRLNETYVSISQRDRFELMMNSLLAIFDADSIYYPPRDYSKLRMSLSLVGTGMILKSEAGYIKVIKCVKNGPCDKTNKIFPDDIIIGVAQANSKFESVTGLRLDDVVNKIRGPKNSHVKLKIKRGANIFQVSLVRDSIKLKEQRVSHQIDKINYSTVTKNIATIKIPKFYIDFEAANRGDKNAISSSRDVKKILNSLQSQNIDGVILDLRGNGGGAMHEVLKIAALFVGKKAISQIKQDKKITIYRNQKEPLLYSGPLMTLVDYGSAGASEILAAAIQDHKRGIVIGQTTHGHGTLRSFENLKLGSAVFTNARYYRVTGQPIHKQAVTPDIVFHFDSNKTKKNTKAYQAIRELPTTPIIKNLDKTSLRLQKLHTYRSNNIPSLESYRNLKQEKQKWDSINQINYIEAKNIYNDYNRNAKQYYVRHQNIDLELTEAKTLMASWLK